jgi:NAD(P)-dependent dehydrogenase (short-subunit alcohol dehydrogenase family)
MTTEIHDDPTFMQRFRLDGRTALITGASRNIGAAIARAFAEAGAKLVLNARGADALETTAAELRLRYAADVTAIAADLAKPAERRRLIDEIRVRVGSIDVLVNNAPGGGRPPTGLETTEAIWNDAIQVNVGAPFELCRAFVPAMRRRGSGSVVNLLSTAAFAVVPPMLAYGAMKSALWTMTKYLARECAPEVRVNAICPGTVQEGGQLKVPTWSKLLPLTALGRVGDSDELACAALFLASDASSYTTGQVVFVDGGRVMMP